MLAFLRIWKKKCWWKFLLFNLSMCRLLSQRLGLENTSEIHFGTLETLMIKSDCYGKIHETLAGKIKFPIAGSYNTDLRLDILGKALSKKGLVVLYPFSWNWLTCTVFIFTHPQISTHVLVPISISNHTHVHIPTTGLDLLNWIYVFVLLNW